MFGRRLLRAAIGVLLDLSRAVDPVSMARRGVGGRRHHLPSDQDLTGVLA